MSMVIVYGENLIREESRAEVEAAAATFMAASRAEPGCVEYTLSWEMNRPDVVRLIEAWETPEAHKAHTEQPHTKEWADLMRSVSLEPPAFHRYNGEPRA